jgi:hypothetical protein
VSRYSDYDDEEAYPGQFELYQANLRRAFKGKRGRKFLADLREALLALPEHRLIEGAMCTVGAAERKAALLAQAERQKAFLDAQFADRWGPAELDTEFADDLDQHVQRDGEGVCGIGAYLWHQKVKAGMDPEEAFRSLPLLLGTEDGGLYETAALAAKEADVAASVAWEAAYRNDETWSDKTPEERHAAFIAWIDHELAEPADA